MLLNIEKFMEIAADKEESKTSSISQAIVNDYGKEQLINVFKRCKTSDQERLVIKTCIKNCGCKNLTKLNSWQIGQIVRNVKKLLKEDKNDKSIKNGSIVKIKPEFQDKGDEKHRYKVSDLDRERCLITLLDSGLALAPTERINVDMLELAE